MDSQSDARSDHEIELSDNRLDVVGQKNEVQGRDADEFVCPVCQARQTRSESCRRCRADLSLVMAIADELDAKRTRCLALIRQRRLMRATELAKACLELSQTVQNRRLLATCFLLQGDFASALEIKHER